ncbi:MULTISPECIES: SDR family NAD(P)-dependent oxidoreductase [unclassified Bosea (in: a-proteobacteria)]|uniref:SDR family NAD(P)-dependent oxidoreductase n=1 Tax=unclassified Bosea (in: a-proteobacteria) TaxID=2653178 RepID=UPI000F7572DB|nr:MULTISPECIES: SDR family NAD(P)-dependent oxidoreductase [unclassified Bosea (in: a-proteobacteria)]AZO76349.1 short-chain dehydrogenase/reductase [Bosea sp. Tri-49]RXT26277.1 short-chain dehydrogenase/reductase [Bosea sp. Tri-39]RXT31518.1 short-chain dehydrogenase/reductase [Bosea sp. Tri-54]
MTKTWLISGAARGLGRSIAEAALAAGDNVVATAREPGRLADLEARYPDTLLSFALDVTDMAAANVAVTVTIDTFGRLDVLVNNAGYGHAVAFEQTSDDSFRAQIETNFYGVVNLTRAALPVLRAQLAGHIINISSVGGRTGTPGLSAYQSAKWAVGGFTEVIAKEVAPFGVKIVSVEPGGMRTGWGEIARGNAPTVMPDYQPSVGAVLDLLKAYVGNEIGDPERIAGIILDLSRRETLPAHLVLGSDALFVLAQAEAQRQKEAAEWADVSRSSDFVGTDLVALQKLLGVEARA